jgi:hypothetical protein
MIAKLFDAFFGCWHSRYSFPITVRARSDGGPAPGLTGTYVVCLDCGKEMPYDWVQMKVVEIESGRQNQVASLAAAKPAA